jgi:hypothetical protein
MPDASSDNSTSPTQRFESYRSKETAGQGEAARRHLTAAGCLRSSA